MDDFLEASYDDRNGTDEGSPYEGNDTTDEDFWSDTPLIDAYPLAQAIEDGALLKLFENRWPQLAAGKPIVVTAALSQAFSLAALRECWNQYVLWRTIVFDTLPEDERLFETTMNGQTLWVLESAEAFTLLFPQDY